MRFGTAIGSCFSLDVDGKQYIVTARHLLPGIEKHAELLIHIEQEAEWRNCYCKVVGFGEDEIDVAVLAPPGQISPTHPLLPTTKGLVLGQDAYFLGFPLNLRSEMGAANRHFPIALVKKACMSMFALDTKPSYLVLDGYCAAGFSGGPCVFAFAGEKITANVCGVVSGYYFDKSEVVEGDQATKLSVRQNAGLVLVYGIDHALRMIKAKPVGAAIAPASAAT
jgi:hypothetical protein